MPKWPIWLTGWVFFYDLNGLGSNLAGVTFIADILLVPSNESIDSLEISEGSFPQYLHALWH